MAAHYIGNNIERLFSGIGAIFKTVGYFLKHIGNDSVYNCVAVGYRLGCARHTEFKLIAGKRKRRCAVAVRIIGVESGNRIDAHGNIAALDLLRCAARFNIFQNIGEGFA